MEYLVVCQYCGKKLMRAEEGSKVKVQCPKCSRMVDIVVEKGSINMTRSKHKKER